MLAVGLVIWGFVIEPDRLVVRHYQLKLKNWNPSLDNYKIVAVSDIHGGSNFIDEKKIRLVAELINEQNPDMIVLLGDFVSEELFDSNKLLMPMETIAENLKNLRAADGVYAVIGNHDGIYDQEKVRSELEKIGARVLENEAVVIRRNAAAIRVLGLSDSLAKKPPTSGILDPKVSLKKLESSDGQLIVLTHHPDEFLNYPPRLCVENKCALFIGGHTHVGQVNVPLGGALIVPTNLDRRYAAGFFELDERQFFITPGIGTSILPVRFNAPPEISVLTLSAE